MTVKELIAILRDEDNCNVLDYIDEAADRLEELSATLEAVKEDRRSCWAEFKALSVAFEMAREENTALSADRDALLQIFKESDGCEVCKYNYSPHIEPCNSCMNLDGWEWQGVNPDYGD